MRKKHVPRKGRRAKVYFELRHEMETYSPAKTEFLWCVPTGRGTYIVDNIPFFVRDVSLNDEISANSVRNRLVFSKVVRESTNSTVRVLMNDNDEKSTNRVREMLDDFGCGTELMAELGLLAVSMPQTARIAEALSFLDKEAELNVLGIEESAVRYK
jgi:hypothetical protein